MSPTTPADDETRRLLHRTIAAVRDDMATLSFNTAIARLDRAEQPPHPGRARASGARRARSCEPLVLMLAPLAPHVAEELWARLGHADTLAYETFPTADPALLVDDTVEVPVQVNGKVRARVDGGGRRRRRRARGRGARRRRGSPRCSTARRSARSSSSPAGSSTSSSAEPRSWRSARGSTPEAQVRVRARRRASTPRGPASSSCRVLTPGVAAMTLGRWILVRRGHEPTSGCIAHELVHVEQWRDARRGPVPARRTSATTARPRAPGSATGPRTVPSRSRPRRGCAAAGSPDRSAAQVGLLPSGRFPERFLPSCSARPEEAMSPPEIHPPRPGPHGRPSSSSSSATGGPIHACASARCSLRRRASPASSGTRPAAPRPPRSAAPHRRRPIAPPRAASVTTTRAAGAGARRRRRRPAGSGAGRAPAPGWPTRSRPRAARCPEADLDRLNLAAKVADGQRILVERVGAPATRSTSAAARRDPVTPPAAPTADGAA